ncbi:hypothetical protein NN561_018272 [Cricetulus griseus]
MCESTRDVLGPFHKPWGPVWQETSHPASACHLGEEEPGGSQQLLEGLLALGLRDVAGRGALRPSPSRSRAPRFSGPRPPCCCGAEAAPAEPSGRDRLRNRFAAADLTTDPAAAAAAQQGLPRRLPVRGCRGARGVARAVTCARRQVGEASRQRCCGERGRCGRRRPGAPRTGRAEGAARRGAPGLVLGRACGPRPRPRPRSAAPGGNLGPRVPAPAAEPAGRSSRRPGHRGPLATASLGSVGAECQVNRIPVRQSSPSHERTVGGCLASTAGVLTAKVGKCEALTSDPHYALPGCLGSTAREGTSVATVKFIAYLRKGEKTPASAQWLGKLKLQVQVAFILQLDAVCMYGPWAVLFRDFWCQYVHLKIGLVINRNIFGYSQLLHSRN